MSDPPGPTTRGGAERAIFHYLPIMTGPSDFRPTRREFLRSAAALTAGLASLTALSAAGAQPAAGAAPRAITVYKDPNCGCCKAWVEHIRKAGFVATVHDTADMASVKASMGVPSSLESCHTARIGPYTIEGHVPADVIVKLLKEKPVGAGLAVGGMPMGSPGMEGGRADKYDVMLFDKSGKSRIYASR